MKELKLKLANLEDAKAEYEAIRKLSGQGLNGLIGDCENATFEELLETYLPKIIANHSGEQLKPGLVPYSTYFLWDDDKIVGIFSFRHCLNDALRKRGGHVGYIILPEFRGRNYATNGLKLLIEEIKDKVLEDELWLDTDVDNIASQKVMLNNGAYIVDENDGGVVRMRIRLEKDNIVSKVKDLVLRESDKYLAEDPGKYDFWNGHLKYVYKEAMNLAEKYGADLEVVQLGALFHDIALLEKVGIKADHHENGKKLAEQILREHGYPEEKAQRVLGCVLHHRSSKNAENLEELCVADADVLAHFDNVPMLFDAAYNLHKMVGMNNVRNFMQETFEKDFDDLSERTKAEFEPKYKVIREVVLGEEK